MKKITFLCILLFIANPFIANAQFQINYGVEEEIEELKQSTLYVIIDEEDHQNNPEYAKILKENWTFSKVEVIESNEFPEYLKAGSYFLTLTTLYPQGFNIEKSPAALIHFYYSLWTPNKEYLAKIKKKNPKKIDFGELAHTIATIDLEFDKSESFKVEDVMSGEFFGNGLPLYSGLGIFKNYLQAFQNLLNTKVKNVYKFVEIRKDEELKELKSNTLYVPSTFLTDNSGSSFLSYTKNKRPLLDSKEIFEDYKYKYQVISLKELNDMILSGEVIYYISKPNQVTINITNSKTGELIYHSWVKENEKTTKKDLKELVKYFKEKK
jgi:hypothetical protein